MNLLKKLFGSKDEPQVVRYGGSDNVELPPKQDHTVNDIYDCVSAVLKELQNLSNKLDTIAKQADIHYRVARGGERYKNLVDKNQEKS